MPNLMPTDIVDDVRRVLANAHAGKGTNPCFLTAFQILDRLPSAIRDRIIAERSIGGAGSGQSYAAPSVVSQAAEMVPGVVIDYIDTRGLTVTVAGRPLTPSYEVCGLYRLN
jgi:hypothetical protein